MLSRRAVAGSGSRRGGVCLVLILFSISFDTSWKVESGHPEVCCVPYTEPLDASGSGVDAGQLSVMGTLCRSADGKTWCRPVNLTRMLKDPGWYLLAPAPGCGIVMQDGTFVVPVQGRDSSQRFFSTIMPSVDPVYPCERLRSHCIASCSDVCMSGDMELELRNRSGSIAPMTKITSLYFLQLG